MPRPSTRMLEGEKKMEGTISLAGVRAMACYSEGGWCVPSVDQELLPL